MPSGGARSTSGPAPDPNSLRSKSRGAEWTVLPSTPRTDEPPAWPLPGQSDREAELWARQWAKPQAAIWIRDGLVDQVAMYVRTLVEGEAFEAPVNRRTLLRQQEDDLLLSSAALARARVRIVTDEVAERRAAAPRESSSRARLTRVTPDAAGA